MTSATDRRGLVEPRTLRGFQDLLPEAMIARNGVIDKIRRVYETYGFVPIDTPILEYLATLIGTGGEDINKQLFRLMSPEQDEDSHRGVTAMRTLIDGLVKMLLDQGIINRQELSDTVAAVRRE